MACSTDNTETNEAGLDAGDVLGSAGMLLDGLLAFGVAAGNGDISIEQLRGALEEIGEKINLPGVILDTPELLLAGLEVVNAFRNDGARDGLATALESFTTKLLEFGIEGAVTVGITFAAVGVVSIVGGGALATAAGVAAGLTVGALAGQAGAEIVADYLDIDYCEFAEIVINSGDTAQDVLSAWSSSLDSFASDVYANFQETFGYWVTGSANGESQTFFVVPSWGQYIAWENWNAANGWGSGGGGGGGGGSSDMSYHFPWY